MIATQNRDADIIELLSPSTKHLIDNHIKRNTNFYGLHAVEMTALSNSIQIPQHPSIGNVTSSRLDCIANDILDDDICDMSGNYLVNAENLYDDANSTINSANSFGLNSQQLNQMKTIRIARNNPFCALKRENTLKTLVAMQAITSEAGQLPKLEAWLDKRQRGWKTRWCIVAESHFLFSDKQRTIRDPKSVKERARFNGHFNLMAVIEIRPITKKSKSQRKFAIVVKEGKKSKLNEYIFRAASKVDRDYWVNGLNVHIAHLKELLLYLGNTETFPL